MGIFSVQDPSNGGSLFRSQANTAFNSFQNPVPTLNMGGPGWDIDRNYMTPSYAAPFRPQSQEGPINSPRPGFFASAYNQLVPWAPQGYGRFGDPFWGQQQYRESLYGRPMDAAMWGAQNIGVGMGSFMAATSLTRGWGSSMASSFGSFGQGVARGALGPGLAGSNIGAGIIGGAGMAGRGAGYLFGGLVAPMLMAQGIVSAADSLVFDPYINQRTTARNFRENFAGTTFGTGEQGSAFFGRGLSFAASNRISTDITKQGFREFGLSGKEISSIADMAGRAGLLDNVQPNQFAKQIASITKQVSVIAAVANDPDFRNSIEIIAKLREAGATVGQAGAVMGRMGGYAGVAGISTKRMMEASEQGRFIYAANGLTPYMGQMAMGQSMASFTAARRMGLMSDALVARMGGIEGAAQSLITGQVNAAQTPYNQIMMANQYMGGMRSSGNMTSDLSNFGAMFGRDPLSTYGAMGLYKGRMMSAQASQNPMAMHDQIMAIARQSNMIGSDGKLDAGRAFILAKQITGDDRAAEAFVQDQLNYGSKRFVDNQIAGQKNAYTKDVATLMEEHGVAMPYGLAKANVLRKKGWASIKEGLSWVADPFAQLQAEAMDKAGGWLDEMKYGASKDGYVSVDDLNKTNAWKQDLSEITWKGQIKKGISKGLKWSSIADLLSSPEGPNSNKEATDRYFSALSSKGSTADEMIKAIQDTEAGVKDSKTVERVQSYLGSKSIMAFKDQYLALEAARQKGGFSTAEEYIRSTGKSTQEVLASFGGQVDMQGVAGNARLEALGDESLLAKVSTRQEGLRKNLDEIRTKASKGMISGSAYAQQMEQYASETNMDAAELQYRAAQLNWASAKTRDPKEAEKVEATVLAQSKAAGPRSAGVPR